MNSRSTLIAIIAALLALTAAAPALGQVNNITQTTAHATIQGAINAAANGDIIEVDPGTYVENINFNGLAITVRSASGDPSDTIVDGNGAFHVVQCVSGEGPDTILDGFTITGGNAIGFFPDDRGGGMLCFSGSSPTVTKCSFTGNSGFGGGGMCNYSSSPTVTNCSFSGNSAASGGGMYNEVSSSPTVTYCSFSGNFGNFGGGGMCNDASSPTVTNCSFSGNLTDDAGGGMLNQMSSSPTVTNCSFSGNTATTSGGGGMFNFSGSSPTVTNCVLWANTPNQLVNNGSLPLVSYCDIQGGLPAGAVDGGGNIDADPLFVDADLRLNPGSPCIDASDADAYLAVGGGPLDLGGEGRLADDTGTPDTGIGPPTYLDMGAHEFHGCSPGPCIGDLDGDGDTDVLDFAIFGPNFGCTTP